MAKMAISVAKHPKKAQSIQGRALPIFVFVLSIREPKKISVKPSNSLETIISVPTMPALRPMVSVR